MGIYRYIFLLYVKIKIFVAGGGLNFFFGDHWDPNETIPTGFALISVFTEKNPLIYIYFEKKTGL